MKGAGTGSDWLTPRYSEYSSQLNRVPRSIRGIFPTLLGLDQTVGSMSWWNTRYTAGPRCTTARLLQDCLIVCDDDPVRGYGGVRRVESRRRGGDTLQSYASFKAGLTVYGRTEVRK